MSAKFILIANLFVTLYLTGLIWTIQVVHYPLFANVGAANWLDYHARHNGAITLIVALPMLLELGLSVLLIVWRPQPFPIALAYVGAALAGVVWLATAGLSVPIHNELARGLDIAAVDRLVITNWVRTLAWTAHAAVLGVGLARCL
jgi:hypothetical protein